jgi:hypothetical protein
LGRCRRRIRTCKRWTFACSKPWARSDKPVTPTSPGFRRFPRIVVQRNPDGVLGMPGRGYYPVNHPQARTDMDKMEEWLREFQAARATAYPQAI